MVAGLTSNTQKAMLKTTALQVVFKLSNNIPSTEVSPDAAADPS